MESGKEFGSYAAKEASASLRRVFTRSREASRQQLEGVRAALDAAAKALAPGAPTSEDEHEIAELVAGLTKAAAAASDKAVKQVSDEAQKAADALRSELEAAVKQKMALTASVKEAQAQAETLRAELKTATDRGETISRQLGDARKANEKLETARTELTAAREEQARARTAAEADLRKTREALEARGVELASATKRLEKIATDNASLEEAVSAANSQNQASEAKLAAVTDLFKQGAARIKLLERTQQEQERTIRELESQRREPAAAVVTSARPLAVFDDLLSAFQALGGAATISDVLTTLVEQLAAQFPRVALFRAKKGHLQGEHQIGFDLKTDIAKVVMPLGMDSLLARAANSGQIERLADDELDEAPFSGTPGSALAIPIIINGEPLAIVYADDAGAASSGGADAYDVNARFAEAMQQHTVALLSRLTSELKTLAELQAYAGSLVRELEQMYAADAQAGMAAEALQVRLKGNLEYARSIYASRIALEPGDAGGLLDDELAALIESEQSSPFGIALATVAGRPAARGKRAAAEAS